MSQAGNDKSLPVTSRSAPPVVPASTHEGSNMGSLAFGVSTPSCLWCCYARKRSGRSIVGILLLAAVVLLCAYGLQLHLSSLPAARTLLAPPTVPRRLSKWLGRETTDRRVGRLSEPPEPGSSGLDPVSPAFPESRVWTGEQSGGGDPTTARNPAKSYAPLAGTKAAPDSASESGSRSSNQLTKLQRKHRCWREPCKFLLPGVLGEQLSKASLHFYQLALLARQIGRTLVLPNVGDSRIESCLMYQFTTYFDIGALDGIVEWIDISEFVEILRERFRQRPNGPGDLRNPDHSKQESSSESGADSPGTAKYNLKHSLTSPPWVIAQYVVFSVQPLSAGIDRHHPRGMRELLKCYREKPTNPTGSPANPLPFTRRMLNFIAPENRREGETDDSHHFPIPVRKQADEAEIWDAYARSVFATLKSLDDVDVLGVHYTWRKPYLFPDAAQMTLDYNPSLWARARRIASTYLTRPFIAVHWRMETVDPLAMPACADMLARYVQQAKRALLEKTGSFGKGPRELTPDDVSVFLANDLPPNNRHRSTTFVNASPLCHAARRRLIDAVPRITTWWSLTVEDRRRAAEEGRELEDEQPGEERWDAGTVGILDKLVCSLADQFIAGPPGCSKGSSFTEQITSLRAGPSRWTPLPGSSDDGERSKSGKETGSSGGREYYSPTSRTPANLVDTWPGPTVGYVRQVVAQYSIDISEDVSHLNQSAEWPGR